MTIEYPWTSSTWLDTGVTLEGEERLDLMGSSVDVSYDGTMIATGAIQ